MQLPINLSMSEALRVSTQRDPKGRLVHVTDAAATLGIDLVASAPLLQGQLAAGLPDRIGRRYALWSWAHASRSAAKIRGTLEQLARLKGIEALDDESDDEIDEKVQAWCDENGTKPGNGGGKPE